VKPVKRKRYFEEARMTHNDIFIEDLRAPDIYKAITTLLVDLSTKVLLLLKGALV
jgi:hypothetical protein